MRHAGGELSDARHLFGLDHGRFHAFSLGEIHHRADHADRFFVFIVDHKTPVKDVGVGAVVPPEAVLAQPGLPAGVNHLLNAGQDSFLVCGMEALHPPFHVLPHLRKGIMKKRLNSLVPPQAVIRQVPVPDRIVGRPGHNLETLLAFLQRGRALFHAFFQILIELAQGCLVLSQLQMRHNLTAQSPERGRLFRCK